METFNMRQADQTEILQFERQKRERQDFLANINRYKIIAELLKGKEADITQDTAVFAAMNKERLALEDYMKLFPADCESALQAVRDERELNEKGWNPYSKAKWRIIGEMPNCVHLLFRHVYDTAEERKKARRRFFNNFPNYRHGTKRV